MTDEVMEKQCVARPRHELERLAGPEERARRRHKQLKDKGLTVTIAGLSQEIRERDLRDSSRPVAPLRPAEDAVILDSTGLTIEQVVDQVLALARSRLPAIS